jgi:hypothetical protein
MWSDNETSEDLLGFKVHADLLIDVVKDDSILPISIGVFGDWGSGKSSILQIIKDRFEEKDENEEFIEKETLCIYFNGWTFEGYDDAKAALLNAILKELEDNKKLTEEVKEAVKEKAKKLWKSIDWMRGAGMVLKNVALPAVSAYFTGGISLIPFAYQKLSEWGADSPEKLIEKLQSEEGKDLFKSLTKEETEVDKKDKTNAVAEFRKDFIELLEVTKFKRLVVIIDDLDRCTPERIIENLEAVKLFLNVPKTAFIIGADPRIVKHAIEHKYKNNSQIEEDNSRIIDDYLEKLIQLPYSLPKLSEPEVETYISMLICKRELDETNFKMVHSEFQKFRKADRYSAFGLTNFETILGKVEFDKVKSNVITIPSLVPLITQSLYGNPRQIKRFLNTYTLRQRLANVASLSNFNDSILAKLMILEYSELKLFKQLFEWQINQDGLPDEIKILEENCIEKTNEESINDLKELKYNDWCKPKVIKWIQVEPHLSQIDLRDYFWISRDKIGSSITASSIVSQIVKKLFNELQIDGMTPSVTKNVIQKQFMQFTEIEKDSFFLLLSGNLKKNQKEKRYYDIFNCMLEENIDNTPYYYMESLKVVDSSNIEAATGLALKNYSSHPEIGEFLINYFKDGKSKASKAFNIKK